MGNYQILGVDKGKGKEMTTVGNSTEKCLVCGNVSDHGVIMSTNSFGAADLDCRPPEMKRSTIKYSVHRCPQCGYCSWDISEEKEKISDIIDIVHSEEYQKQLNNIDFPDKANEFLCRSILEEKAGNCDSAFFNALHAAWICDDKGNNEAAISCRNKAVSTSLSRIIPGKDIIDDEEKSQNLIIIDLLRRTGRFRDALDYIDSFREKNNYEQYNDFQKKIISLQKSLVEVKDDKIHKMSEVKEKE
jgi:hypothetical protein